MPFGGIPPTEIPHSSGIVESTEDGSWRNLFQCRSLAGAYAEALDRDESAAQTNSGRLGAGGRAQLAQDGADVKLHGVGRDVELRGDLFIREALHHHLEHLPLAHGEVFGRTVGDGSGVSRGVIRHFAYYNFCRIHQTLRVTPAMEAGLADHAWKIRELLAQ